LRNKINTFDPHYLGIGANNVDKTKMQEVKMWIETIPSHKVLYIKNYESNGYWDFWNREDKIPGCDCNTISGLLDSIKGKLDGNDNELGEFSGQIMFYLYELDNKVAECYGVRLPADYQGELPSQMICDDVPAGEYLIFAHPTFDYETMSQAVIEKVKETVQQYSLDTTEYEYEEKNGRIGYLYHSPEVWGYRIVRPIRKLVKNNIKKTMIKSMIK
jgi:AraC family transcriptional regulator